MATPRSGDFVVRCISSGKAGRQPIPRPFAPELSRYASFSENWFLVSVELLERSLYLANAYFQDKLRCEMTGREIAERTMKKLRQAIGGQYPACPFCSNRNWSVSDTITLTSSFDPATGAVDPTSGVPGVSLTCDNCGYTASVNPKALGVLDDQ